MEANERVATLNIRVIRSFQHRNIRNVVLKDVPLETTSVSDLRRLVTERLATAPGLPPPVRRYDYDTFKIEHQAHGAKTNDPCINRHDDERLILRDGATLPAQGVGHETEISFFKMADYEAYKQDPVLKWN